MNEDLLLRLSPSVRSPTFTAVLTGGKSGQSRSVPLGIATESACETTPYLCESEEVNTTQITASKKRPQRLTWSLIPLDKRPQQGENMGSVNEIRTTNW